MDEFDDSYFEQEEYKCLKFESDNGFKLRFHRNIDDPSKILLYQEVYEEDLYIMEITRHELGDFIYKLESLLDD